VNYRPEVIADNSGKWVSNQLVFATQDEAASYVNNLMLRWTLVLETRVVEVDEPANHRWIAGHKGDDGHWVEGHSERIEE
jgi:hypothetical protein